MRATAFEEMEIAGDLRVLLVALLRNNVVVVVVVVVCGAAVKYVVVVACVACVAFGASSLSHLQIDCGSSYWETVDL